MCVVNHLHLQYTSKETVFPKVFRAFVAEPCYQDAAFDVIARPAKFTEALLTIPAFSLFHVYCHPASENWHSFANEHPDWRIN